MTKMEKRSRVASVVGSMASCEKNANDSRAEHGPGGGGAEIERSVRKCAKYERREANCGNPKNMPPEPSTRKYVRLLSDSLLSFLPSFLPLDSVPPFSLFTILFFYFSFF
jgi:hypothetical protein